MENIDVNRGVPLQLSHLLHAISQVVFKGLDYPQSLEHLISIHKTVGEDPAMIGNFCGSAFVSDEQFEAITRLIPDSLGETQCSSQVQNGLRTSLGLTLLQVSAKDPANTAVLLGAHSSFHPLLKLRTSIRTAYESGEVCRDSTLKRVVSVLINFQTALSFFCTEDMRRQVLQCHVQGSYSLEYHAVIAWNAIQNHIFGDSYDEAVRWQRVEALFNLRYGQLLAKTVILLRDVLDPLQQRQGNSAGTMQILGGSTGCMVHNDTCFRHGFFPQPSLNSSVDQDQVEELAVPSFQCVDNSLCPASSVTDSMNPYVCDSTDNLVMVITSFASSFSLEVAACAEFNQIVISL